MNDRQGSVYDVLNPAGRQTGSVVAQILTKGPLSVFRGRCNLGSVTSELYAECVGPTIKRLRFKHVNPGKARTMSYETWLVPRAAGWKQVRRKLGQCWNENSPDQTPVALFDFGHVLLPWLVLRFPGHWSDGTTRFISTERNISGTVHLSRNPDGGSSTVSLRPFSRYAKLRNDSFEIIADASGLLEIRYPALGLRMRRSKTKSKTLRFGWVPPPRVTRMYAVPGPGGREEEVTFRSPDGTSLAGTIEWPKRLPVAVCILVHGSGMETRNSGNGFEGRDIERFPAQPFLELSRKLAAGNIAVLRYDKRGVGVSQGDWIAVTRSHLAMDLTAAIDRIHNTQPDLPLFLIGFSEGAALAVSAAAARPFLGGIVLAAGPAEHVDRVILQKMPGRFKSGGLDAPAIRVRIANQAKKFAAIRKLSRTGETFPAGTLEGHSLAWWADHFQHQSPAEEAGKVSCPVLVLHGRDDAEVLPDQGRRLVKAFRNAGNPVTAVWLKGLNHMFTKSCPSHPGFEYDIPFEIAPDVPRIIRTWVNRISRKQK